MVDVPRSFLSSMVASLSVTNLMQLLAAVEVSSVERRRMTSSLLYWGTPESSWRENVTTKNNTIHVDLEVFVL